MPIVPAAATDRLPVVDILRGLALFGMILAHVNDLTPSLTPLGGVVRESIFLFVYTKAGTAFAILIGVSFAIQLGNAQARYDAFRSRWLRRLAGLAVFGLIAEAFFGYAALIAYAVWAVPLLFMTRWPVRALLLAALLCAMSLHLHYLVAGSYRWVTGGAAYANAIEPPFGSASAATRDLRQAESRPSFPMLVAARLRHMWWFYSQPFSFTPWNTLCFFLFGMAALRAGVWHEPAQHRRVIIAAMIVGFVSWITAEFVIPFEWPQVAIRPVDWSLQHALGLARTRWLALTYLGAGLLIIGSSPPLQRRLAIVGSAGQMALTNYLVHAAVLDMTFRSYGLGLRLPSELVPLAALVFFAGLAMSSHCWLARYRFGPAEWCLRTLTYGRLQPFRRPIQASPSVAAAAVRHA